MRVHIVMTAMLIAASGCRGRHPDPIDVLEGGYSDVDPGKAFEELRDAYPLEDPWDDGSPPYGRRPHLRRDQQIAERLLLLLDRVDRVTRLRAASLLRRMRVWTASSFDRQLRCAAQDLDPGVASECAWGAAMIAEPAHLAQVIELLWTRPAFPIADDEKRAEAWSYFQHQVEFCLLRLKDRATEALGMPLAKAPRSVAFMLTERIHRRIMAGDPLAYDQALFGLKNPDPKVRLAILRVVDDTSSIPSPPSQRRDVLRRALHDSDPEVLSEAMRRAPDDLVQEVEEARRKYPSAFPPVRRTASP